MKSHVAKLEKSKRLKRLLEVFKRHPNVPLSTIELIKMADVCAVNSACHELRQNGVDISPARYIAGHYCYTYMVEEKDNQN